MRCKLSGSLVAAEQRAGVCRDQPQCEVRALHCSPQSHTLIAHHLVHGVCRSES
jgi:hypothetical protein